MHISIYTHYYVSNRDIIKNSTLIYT
ncbi:hypothetical protein ACMD2_24836 [Ananas comosus]|uniref:Uncharacterized protein n=1 Tax=Ananas comosus TaxID=4615 RepID=A0A199UP29_ANACO|nr:hypothetical protein ACMD2_24836 [Ananas comosus]